ncbi:MAG: chromosomal replication initiator protein DnaA [Phycisphaerales bacterium]|nr:chromosomal replication initiator protein DnaA [Phycisphaerales bacterium]
MATIGDRTWGEMLDYLRSKFPHLSRSWFDSLVPTDFQHGVIRICCADVTQHKYLSEQCQSAFSEAAQVATGRLVTVGFVPVNNNPITETRLSFELEEGQLALNKNYTFDNFVSGPCNRLPHAAGLAVAERPGQVYNPLFIHGDVGLGKTHLVQAICHQMYAQGLKHVLYISCETFTNHFIEAIERGCLHRFRDRYRHVDALVIDDVQFLAARERSREEFFHTFNALYQSQRQIILTADESPAGIPSLEERLVSRFNWGLVAIIERPCLETRMAIVRKKAKLNCVDLPEDVVHFIAAHAESNIREIEGALTRVQAFSQQFGGEICLDMAREALGSHVGTTSKSVTIQDIFQAATEHYGVRPTDLQSKRRNRSIAFPRQVCMYLARELTRLSLEEIGGYFGGRDHTTVLHAIRTIKDQRQQDELLNQNIGELMRLLLKKGEV